MEYYEWKSQNCKIIDLNWKISTLKFFKIPYNFDKMDLKEFEKLKEEMKKDWEKEIVNPSDLLKTSLNFFLNLTYDYTVRCLFIEFLDFQIHLKGEINERYLSAFFKKEVKQFPFPLLPNFDGNYISKKNFSKNIFSQDAQLFLIGRQNNSKNIDNIKFLNEDPSLNYYFWNITFPHMFCEFVSNEFCYQAKQFLLTFRDNEDIFLLGAKSFISHNYNFQDYFMKLYFINSKENTGRIKCIQESLEKSIERLTIPQLDILEILFNDYTEKAKKIFLDIIVNSIKLWKYSPLCSSPKILIHNGVDLINELEKTDLDTFFTPIIKKIKLKITSNDIYIKHLIIDHFIKYVVTFLDLLILEKITGSKNFGKQYIQEYFKEFKPSYFLKEAFSYSVCEASISKLKNDNFKLPQLEKSFDQNIVKKWNTYKEECISRNKKPLEFISNPQLYKKFIETHGQDLAIVGVQLSHNENIYLTEVRKILLNENIALIPFKANIESVKSFTQLYSNYYASTFPFNHDSFVKEIRDLYINFFIYDMISAFKELSSEKIEEIEELINDRLSKNFNEIFNTNNPDILINKYKSIKEELSITYLQSANDRFLDEIIRSLRFNFEFLSYLTKSQLVVAYSNFPFKAETEKPIQADGSDYLISEFFTFELQKYTSTGIYNYIYYNIYSKENKIQMGNFLAFVSEICYLLPQFIEGDNFNYFKKKLMLSDETELTQTIFIYSLNLKEISNQEIAKAFNSLIYFLKESFNEIKKLMADVPNLFELYDQICYLLKYLGGEIDEENDSKEINKTDSTEINENDSTENQDNNNE